MTPERLYAALDARRRTLGLSWWQVAVALDVGEDRLRALRRGVRCQALTERAPGWLRRPAPTRKE